MRNKVLQCKIRNAGLFYYCKSDRDSDVKLYFLPALPISYEMKVSNSTIVVSFMHFCHLVYYGETVSLIKIIHNLDGIVILSGTIMKE
jgi:hypothetical protein